MAVSRSKPISPARMAVVVAAAAAFACITPAPVVALADAAPPWSPGDPVGAPSGPVKDVYIEHEDLSLDMTGVAGSDPRGATVEAAYNLRNDGAARRIDLVFVTSSTDVSRVELTLDGAPVSSVQGMLGTSPSTWQPPAVTPAIGGGPDLAYRQRPPAAITFEIDLGVGEHVMRSRYVAMAARYSGDATAHEPVFWQLAFVLAPARQWEGFGDLDVIAKIPAGWRVATRPSLVRTGDSLTGHFSGIPADSIALTTQMPVPSDPTPNVWEVGLVAIAIVALVAGLSIGRRAGYLGVLASLMLVAPALAGALGFGVVLAAESRGFSIPSAQQSWWGARGTLLGELWNATKAFCSGLLIGEVALLVGLLFSPLSRRVRATWRTGSRA